MNKPKIYITGMGAVTPVGIGVSEYWKGLKELRCGIKEISEECASVLQIKYAAQIQDYNSKDYLTMRLVQDLEPYMQYAYIAAEEAVNCSKLDTKSDKIGIVMATALGGLVVSSETYGEYAVNKKQAAPKFLTKTMGNIAAAQFAINHGIKGPSMTVSTACSSGGDAITLASLLIRSGAADAMIVMGGEAAICPTLIQSLTKLGALSKSGKSRPFDILRNGFVIAEGGGALVLESEKYIQQRGVQPLAELIGCANNTDAFNPVSPDPDGKGAAACMFLALQDAGILPENIDYINAHGTATVTGDIAEAKAINKIFGNRNVPISSTKGYTGHMMGAGGITEVIACVKAIQEKHIPQNFGCTHVDPKCNLNIVTELTSPQKLNIAMSNSFGFGGQNSCIIVKGI